VLRREQGRLAEIEDLVRASVAEHPTYLVFRCVLVHVLCQTGDEDGARAALAALAGDRFAASIGRRDDARRHFAAAVALHRRIGASTWLARTERDAARLLDG
jgi:hypothetical protein